MASLETKKIDKKFNTIVLGNNFTTAKNSLICGENNAVNVKKNAFVIGQNNVVANGIESALITGDNNVITLPIDDSGNTVSTVTNITLLGVYDQTITATTSDTVYVPNIQFTSTASTINGVAISAVTTSANIWTIGEGLYSAVQVGGGNTASGPYSIAEGYLTNALGIYSHAEGYSTTASGNTSHAEGYNTEALGFYSHAECYSTKAIGDYSHAEGAGTQAIGITSHVEGESSIASGITSHAEGYLTTAIGNFSHTEGAQTIVYKNYGHAGGNGTVANYTGEWARSSNGPVASSFGQYGIVDYLTSTNNAALTEIFISNNIVGSERFSIQTGTAYRYKLTMLAQTTGGAVKEWVAEGLIKNVTGTTSMVGSTNVSTWADASMAAVSLGVTANNTNDSLLIEVTGLAATLIYWYGKLEYTRIG